VGGVVGQTGGGEATDGVILVSIDTPLSEVQTGLPGAQDATGNDSTLLWIAGGLLAVGGYLYYKKQQNKKSIYG
jgi:LPXTG-motif cell wall-anchored protein